MGQPAKWTSGALQMVGVNESLANNLADPGNLFNLNGSGAVSNPQAQPTYVNNPYLDNYSIASANRAGRNSLVVGLTGKTAADYAATTTSNGNNGGTVRANLLAAEPDLSIGSGVRSNRLTNPSGYGLQIQIP